MRAIDTYEAIGNRFQGERTIEAVWYDGNNEE